MPSCLLEDGQVQRKGLSQLPHHLELIQKPILCYVPRVLVVYSFVIGPAVIKHTDPFPAGPAQGRDGNDNQHDTTDTDNDYTYVDTATVPLLFLIPPHNHGINPSAPTQAGAHVENAENA